MKTVYILGAGFSIEAGAPTQAAIISEAFKLYQDNATRFDEQRFADFTGFLREQLKVINRGHHKRGHHKRGHHKRGHHKSGSHINGHINRGQIFILDK